MNRTLKKSLSLLLAVAMMVSMVSVCFSAVADDEPIIVKVPVQTWNYADFTPATAGIYQPYNETLGWKAGLHGAAIVYAMNYTFTEQQEVTVVVQYMDFEEEVPEEDRAQSTAQLFVADVDVQGQMVQGPTMDEVRSAEIKTSPLGYQYKEYTWEHTIPEGKEGTGECRIWARNAAPLVVYSFQLWDTNTGEYLYDWSYGAFAARPHQGLEVSSIYNSEQPNAAYVPIASKADTDIVSFGTNLEAGNYGVEYVLRSQGGSGTIATSAVSKDASPVSSKNYTAEDVTAKFGRTNDLMYTSFVHDFTADAADDYTLTLGTGSNTAALYVAQINLFEYVEMTQEEYNLYQFETAVAALPDVEQITLSDTAAMERAQGYYELLTPEQIQALDSAIKEKYEACLERVDYLADPLRVVSQISALPGSINTTHTERITAIRELYETLDDTQRAQVDNYDGLLRAEALLEAASHRSYGAWAGNDLIAAAAEGGTTADLPAWGITVSAEPGAALVSGFTYEFEEEDTAQFVVRFTADTAGLEDDDVLMTLVLATEDEENRYDITVAEYNDLETVYTTDGVAYKERSISKRIAMGAATEVTASVLAGAAAVNLHKGAFVDPYSLQDLKVVDAENATFADSAQDFIPKAYATGASNTGVIFENLTTKVGGPGKYRLEIDLTTDAAPAEDTIATITYQLGDGEPATLNVQKAEMADNHILATAEVDVAMADWGKDFTFSVENKTASNLTVKYMGLYRVQDTDNRQDYDLGYLMDAIEDIGTLTQENHARRVSLIATAEALLEAYVDRYEDDNPDILDTVLNADKLTQAREDYEAFKEVADKLATTQSLVDGIDAALEAFESITEENCLAQDYEVRRLDRVYNRLFDQYGEEINEVIPNLADFRTLQTDLAAYVAQVYPYRWVGEELADANTGSTVGIPAQPYIGYYAPANVSNYIFHSSMQGTTTVGHTYAFRVHFSIDECDVKDNVVLSLEVVKGVGDADVGKLEISRADYEKMEKYTDIYGSEYAIGEFKFEETSAKENQIRIYKGGNAGAMIYKMEYVDLTDNRVISTFNIDHLFFQTTNLGRNDPDKCEKPQSEDVLGVQVFSSMVNGTLYGRSLPLYQNTGSGYLVSGLTGQLQEGDYMAEFVLNTMYGTGDYLVAEVLLDGEVVRSRTYTSDDVIAQFGNTSTLENATVQLPFAVSAEDAGKDFELRIRVNDKTDVFVSEVRVTKDTIRTSLAEAAVTAINAIGEVTYENYTQKEELLAAADAAVKAYNDLYGDAETAISNYGTYADVTAAVDQFVAVDKVKMDIEALPEVTESNFKSVATRIENIKNAMAALDDSLKALIDTTKMEAAEVAVKAAETSDIITRIDGIGEITGSNYAQRRASVNRIRTDYDALIEKYGEEYAAEITNLSGLIKAETLIYAYANQAFGKLTGGEGQEKVTANDALFVLKYSVKAVTMDERQLVLADVNLSGGVDANDALVLLKYSAHGLDELPYVPESSTEE